MVELFDRIAAALYEEDDPRTATRLVFEILRDGASDLPGAVVSPDQWRKAFDSLLEAADRADATTRQSEAEARRRQWPEFKQALESIGCRVCSMQGSDTAWSIEGPGVYVELDLKSGDVEGLDHGMIERVTVLNEAVGPIRRGIEAKLKREAEKGSQASASSCGPLLGQQTQSSPSTR